MVYFRRAKLFPLSLISFSCLLSNIEAQDKIRTKAVYSTIHNRKKESSIKDKFVIKANNVNDAKRIADMKLRRRAGGYFEFIIGAFAGKFIVHLAAQGVYTGIAGGVGLIFPPAAYPTYAALQFTLGPTVEYYSVVGAIVGGITLGTATGPV